MHLCQGNWVEIGRAVVYYARAAHTFSAEIKCPHCSYHLIILAFLTAPWGSWALTPYQILTGGLRLSCTLTYISSLSRSHGRTAAIQWV